MKRNPLLRRLRIPLHKLLDYDDRLKALCLSPIFFFDRANCIASAKVRLSACMLGDEGPDGSRFHKVVNLNIVVR